jgi:hypothetical protein
MDFRIWLLKICMISSRPKYGGGPLNFLGSPMILKSVFLAVNAS